MEAGDDRLCEAVERVAEEEDVVADGCALFDLFNIEVEFET